MLTDIEQKLLVNNLRKNGLNSMTTDYIIKYCNVSTDIFNFNHNIMIKRISNNICKNIIKDKKKSFFFNPLASFTHNTKQIVISSKITNEDYITSLILHEIDHAATYSKNTKAQEKQYMDIFNQKLNQKYSYIYKIPFIKKTFYKYARRKFLKKPTFSTGFYNPLAQKAFGINLNLLKEGVTTYKQTKYENYLDLKDKITVDDSFYKNALNVVNTIVKIIGEENLINFEQNNDFLSLKECFETNTQNQIPFIDLIKKLNRAEFDTRDTLKNQQILDRTLKKAELCKKAFDNNITLQRKNYSIREIEKMLSPKTFIPKVNVNYKISHHNSSFGHKNPKLEQNRTF